MFRTIALAGLIFFLGGAWAAEPDKACANELVVTRFAPSPTGSLHIGGARTALFNYLYAKRMGGRFLLRIEDTDVERSRPEHVDSIVDSLQWLGIEWDGEIVMQSERRERHQQVARQLVEAGLAYHCFLTPEELQKMRQQGRKVQSPWRDRDAKFAPQGVQPVVRLKAPREGFTVVKDTVQGTIRFENKQLDDMVLLRSDGTPTYNFAVVVDDHDMGVTHVIRGVDHLTNAARQQTLYEALGWKVPQFAHVPLIHSAGGKKLSKRDGAVGAPDFRAQGFLPAAIRNYLARLGWGHGNDEVFSTEQAAKWFDLRKVRASPARLDLARLASLNREYIRSAPDEELLAAMKDIVPPSTADAMNDRGAWSKLASAMPELKKRARTLGELHERSAFLWAEAPLTIPDEMARYIGADERSALAALLPRLTELASWDAGAIENEIRGFAAQTGTDLSRLGTAVRVAVTAADVGVPLFDALAWIGREEALARLRDQAR